MSSASPPSATTSTPASARSTSSSARAAATPSPRHHRPRPPRHLHPGPQPRPRVPRRLRVPRPGVSQQPGLRGDGPGRRRPAPARAATSSSPSSATTPCGCRPSGSPTPNEGAHRPGQGVRRRRARSAARSSALVGASVSQQALRALIVFLVLVALVMALYFRNWKMAVAGLIALLHDLVITVGIYALDRLRGHAGDDDRLPHDPRLLPLRHRRRLRQGAREHRRGVPHQRTTSLAQAANLAVNQTLVRSINTTVVALLPIAAVLVVGFIFLGPGTLLDLVARALRRHPGRRLLLDLHRDAAAGRPAPREPAVVELDKKVARHQARKARTSRRAEARARPAASSGRRPAAVGSGVAAAAEREVRRAPAAPVHKYAQPRPARATSRGAPRSRKR